jgi:hypothetical protein
MVSTACPKCQAVELRTAPPEQGPTCFGSWVCNKLLHAVPCRELSYCEMSSKKLWFLVLFLLAGLQLAASQTSIPTPTSTSSPIPTCGFRGDENTYGLGIRIGVYLQWISSTIAYNFLPQEAVNMRIFNTSFQIANFAGLLYITIMKGTGQPSGKLYAVECWIVLTFCLGGVASGRSRDKPNSRSQAPNFAGHRASVIGSLVQLAIGAAMTFYAVWFFYVGMDRMEKPPCSRYAFFFAKVVSSLVRSSQ